MTGFGFDRGRLEYGLRTAGAVAIAFWLAWGLGLEHPQWAGMTVWAASQPVRAHLIEKSLFRGLGTLVGAVFGVLLAALAARTGGPPLLVAGVAVWLGLCAGAGNLLRGFASYGALLAGYSAVMVALLDAGHPEDVVALGLDRSATVLLGVAVALLVGLAFTPPGAEADIPRRLRLAGARILAAIAGHLRDGRPVAAAELNALLSDLARLDDEIDGDGAGSLAARREARNRREMVMAQVAAILWLKAPTAAPDPGLAREVAAIAALTEANAPAADRRVALARAARRGDAGLRRVFAALGAALPRSGAPASPEPDRRPEPLALERDWVAAREAGVRAGLVMLLIGAVWVATGWSAGPLMMLGAAIMTSVFSTFDNPFVILPKVAAGQALGVAAAIACRWLAWPHLGSEAALVAAVMPFILAGGVLTGVPRLQVQTFDYNMVVLLLLQPALPLTGSFGHSVMVGIAVASAPLVAWVAFRLIHPPSARRRRDALARTMVREVEAMAARPGARAHGPIWRARLHHRLLRLVRWSDRLGAGTPEAVEAGLAVLRLGQAVLRLEARLAEPGLSDSARRTLALALRRIAAVSAAPERTAAALAAAARRGGRDAPLLAAAAEAAHTNAALLAAAR